VFNSCASVCTHTTVNQHIEHNRYTCYGHYLNVTEAHQPLTFTTTHFLPVYFLPLHFLPLQLHIPMSYLFSLQLWGAWRFPIMSYPFYKHVMYGKCRFEENLIEVCAGDKIRTIILKSTDKIGYPFLLNVFSPHFVFCFRNCLFFFSTTLARLILIPKLSSSSDHLWV